MKKEVKVYANCCTPGLAGTTPIHIKQTEDGKHEARMGFALFGSANLSEQEMKRLDYNPFHEEFYDNYASGIGDSEDAAIDALKADLESTYESMWIS